MDSVNIAGLNVRWVRLQYAFVLQETVIFNGTVEDNIRLNVKHVGRKEVVDACREADIHADFISLPDVRDAPDSILTWKHFILLSYLQYFWSSRATRPL